jgi:hypothetical protein
LYFLRVFVVENVKEEFNNSITLDQNSVREIRREMEERAYPEATLSQEISFVHHEDVKDNLEDARLENFGCCLDLAEEQLERVQSHTLGDRLE